MAKEYEVIIIGGGIMGSTTAYYLSKHFGPNKVLLLEQFDWLHRRGSSHGESRIIRRTYNPDFYTFLMNDAYKLWEEAEKESNTKVFTQTGGIDFCKNGSSQLNALIEGAKKHKIPFELFDAQKMKEKFPPIKLLPGWVGLYSPDSGVLNATKSVSMFQILARMSGCDLKDNSTVVNIEQSEPLLLRVTLKTGEEFMTKKCIVVAGAWTKNILKTCFKFDVPLQPVQTTLAYWKVDNPEAYSSKNFPVFISHDEPMLAYGTPLQEYPNMIKCGPHGGPNCDPSDRNFQADMNDLKIYVQPFLKECFTGVDLTPTMTETCLYTMSPDENFIIDTLPFNSNIIIGCGFSRHGFKLGPVVGKILSELAISGQHPYPSVHKYFTLSRFDQK